MAVVYTKRRAPLESASRQIGKAYAASYVSHKLSLLDAVAAAAGAPRAAVPSRLADAAFALGADFVVGEAASTSPRPDADAEAMTPRAARETLDAVLDVLQTAAGQGAPPPPQ
jgi:hypothetical protein